MNRGYTRSEYLEFIARVTEKLPDCTIAGDIIVGFPTETDAEFEETVSLVRAVPFKNNFIFKYSPRPGTVAIDRFEDDVPTEVKKLRNNLLLDIQTEVSRKAHAVWVGRRVKVLIEEIRDEFRGETRAAMPPAEASREALSVGSRGEISEDFSHPESRRVELRWNRRQAVVNAGFQAVGRTPGDLITVTQVPEGSPWRASPQALAGRVLEVEITASSPLLLHARLA
jgi:tRNA-2-methylthio-N6-dimethylallyladenosine synthase